MEINRSALCLFAMSARLCNGIKTSVLRVYTIFKEGNLACILAPSSNAIFNAMCFSLESLPKHPESCPP